MKSRKPDTKCEFTLRTATLDSRAVVSRQENALHEPRLRWRSRLCPAAHSSSSRSLFPPLCWPRAAIPLRPALRVIRAAVGSPPTVVASRADFKDWPPGPTVMTVGPFLLDPSCFFHALDRIDHDVDRCIHLIDRRHCRPRLPSASLDQRFFGLEHHLIQVVV